MPTIQVFQPTRILSSTTASDLLDGVNRSLENGTIHILVDLQNVLFMDSTGLSAIVVAFKRVRAVNGRFALCALNGQARMLLERSGMKDVFEVYETPAEFNQAVAGS